MRLISAVVNFYGSHAIALQKLSNERSYKFSWILTLTEVTSIWVLCMHLISAIMNFYESHGIALEKLSNERSYKFSWILTLTEAISIIILRIIYTIMNFYWSMLLPFKNCPISSYKFSLILTLTEVRTIRILRMSLISTIMNFYGSHNFRHFEFLLVPCYCPSKTVQWTFL